MRADRGLGDATRFPVYFQIRLHLGLFFEAELRRLASLDPAHYSHVRRLARAELARRARLE